MSEKRIAATETSFEILDQLKDTQGKTITEIADELGPAKSTVHRHLSTLVDLGYVIKSDDKYHLSLRFLEFGDYARREYKLYSVLKPEVDELATQTGERIQIMIEENGHGVYIYQNSGDKGIITQSHIGKRVYLHSVASGKAYLADSSDEYVDEVVESIGLPQVTPDTITSPDQLRSELEQIRNQGYALNDEENGRGIRAVGATIHRDDSGEVIGALSVAGPKTRLEGYFFNETLPKKVQEVAAVLSTKATYQ